DSFEAIVVDTTICQGQSIMINGTNFNSNVSNVLDTARYLNSGCDSIHYDITVSVDSFEIVVVDTTICQGQSIMVNGTSYNNNVSNVLDTARFLNSGCDSVLYDITLSVDSFESIIVDTTICQGQSITVNGTSYNSNVSNVLDTVRYLNSGCDSIHYDITVNVDSFEAIVVDTTICQGQSITVNGTSYNSNVSNILDTSRYVISGCDSIHYDITVKVDSFEMVLVDTTICQGQSIMINGTSYNSNVSNVLDTARYVISGCDSIHYDITVNVDSFENITIDTTLCEGEILMINGTPYSGNITNVLDTVRFLNSGCDSIHYDISIHTDSVNVTTIDTTICQGETLTVNGVNYNSTGTYGDTAYYTNSACDSLRIDIILKVDSFENIFVDTTLCQGETITVNGTTYNSNVSNVLDTARYINSGCDSIYFDISVNIDSFENIIIDTTLCQGESIIVNGNSYNYNLTNLFDTARYVDSGCDSIYFDITIRIDSVLPINIDTTLCQGQSITVNGNLYNSNVTNVLDTARYIASGCDSIHYNITVSIDSVMPEIIDTTICQGESITVNGTTYNSSVTNVLDTARYINSACDSIHYDITLRVDTFIVETQNYTICEGDSVIIDGITYNTTGTYIDTINFVDSGCDSLRVVINVSVNPTYDTTLVTSICANEMYTLPDGTMTNVAGIYPFPDTTTLGCDSLYTVNLSINALPTGTNNTAICAGDSIFLGGAWQNTAGNYIDTLANGTRCDSILTTTLTINALPNVTANASSLSLCQGESLTLTGGGATTYTWTGGAINNTAFIPTLGTTTYIVTGTDGNTCVDTASVSVLVSPTYNSTLNVAICETALPYTFPDGSVHNTSTDINQTSTLTTINNCDSIIVTNLTVNQIGVLGTIPDSIAVCESFNIQIEMNAQNMQTFQWQLNNGSGFVNIGDTGIYSGTNTATLTISPLDTILTGNIYRILMTDECGNGGYQDETFIRVSEPQEIENALEDVVRCLRDSSLIYVDYNGYNYVWNNGQTGQFLMIEEAGNYEVSFIENGTNCAMTDDFDVVIEDCIENCVVMAPTGFSPQTSSGSNDVFRVMTSCEEGFSFFEFKVYNRWGELVFITNDSNEGWDGTYKGKNAEIGVFVYYLEYTKNGINEKQTAKGQVTLIR
ncbi:MAG: gliding motility-associated C-terminal domain-containing protein, partial [Chitinophagales bacterium]